MTTIDTPRTTTGRAIGYRRVSTEAQLDGMGLEIQGDAIRTTTADLDLVAIYTDEGISGSEGLDGRAGLAQALDDLEAHPGTTLVVPRLDRLARDLMVQESVLADIWAHGGAVLSCSETERAYCHPDDPSDPARTLIRQVLGAVAAYERKMIRLRMVTGRRRRLAATGWAGGPEPYGWSDATEQQLLADITAARAAGTSWRKLVAHYNETGRLKRNGKPWTAPELHAVYTKALRRPA
jgi:DNA invertase Pin-like site-specific DNA recombinase